MDREKEKEKDRETLGLPMATAGAKILFSFDKSSTTLYSFEVVVGSDGCWWLRGRERTKCQRLISHTLKNKSHSICLVTIPFFVQILDKAIN